MQRTHLLLAAVAFLLGVGSVQAQEPQPVLVGMPAYGVTLSGTLAAPTIENHSGKTILAYTVKFLEANGGGPTYSGIFGKAGLADGRKGDVADPRAACLYLNECSSTTLIAH